MKQDPRTGLWLPDSIEPKKPDDKPKWPPVLEIPEDAKTSDVTLKVESGWQ